MLSMLQENSVGDENRESPGEWSSLQSDPVASPTNSTRIGNYWQKILELETPGGEVKYQASGRVVRAALLLCHGSIDVEQGFYRSALMMTSMQARTEESILNAKVLLLMLCATMRTNPSVCQSQRICCVFPDQLDLDMNLTIFVENRMNCEKKINLEAEKKDVELAVQDLVQRNQKITALE